MNNQGMTVDNVKGIQPIGHLRNNWRQRDVLVYPHPTNPAEVITVGNPYEGGEPIVCVEDRQAYERTINLYPKTATYD